MSNIINYIILGAVVFILILFLGYFIYKSLKKLIKRSKHHKMPTSFKCIDGDIVKSKGELIIDNYLFINGIEHEYERKIKVNGNAIKTDWYLPKIDTYIEYWGYYGKEYEKRKQEKIKLYRKGKLNLISIENIMFEDIYTNIRNIIKSKFNLKIDNNKFCPNCGNQLDNRF